MTAPCLNCTERHAGCHSTCAAYLAFYNERIEIAKAKKRQKDIDDGFYKVRK